MLKMTGTQERVCMWCGRCGEPNLVKRGHDLVEIALWFMIVPGIFYSLWRYVSARIESCVTCGSPSLLPANSPRGRRMIHGRA